MPTVRALLCVYCGLILANVRSPSGLHYQDCMMTSPNGNIFSVTGPLCGEFTGPGEFPAQRPVRRSFDVFFHLRLNKRLSKQPRGWWFETPPWSLWRQCNGDDSPCVSEVLPKSTGTQCPLFHYERYSNHKKWLNVMWCDVMWCDVIRCDNTTQYSTTKYSTIPYNTIRFDTI